MHEAEDPLRLALVSALGAQYDVLRLIGRGGMGAVYLGRERLLDRLVAIKVLPHESADTEDARDRFLREARTAARLTHPHVVPLFSFGEAGKTLFYIMGYVEGESLELRLRRDGRLTFDEVRRLLAELASALEHAHSQGIVHRDIKPDNVLLERGTGRAVLTDFGIARQQMAGQTITQTGVVLGTPLYMSPEQSAGERDLDGRSDLYSLGVMGYRMLTGRLPFEGGSFQELIAQHMTREATPPSIIVPDVPDDLEAAVQRCLAKDPAHRWASAALLKEALGGGDGEVSLPPELEKLPSSASSSIIWGWFGLWVGASFYAFSGDSFYGLVAFMGVPMGLIQHAAHQWRARKHGLSPKRTRRIALWPPRPWHFWWPRALRRPGDVWDQLPLPLRRTRAWMSAAALGAAGVFLPLIVFTLALGFRGVTPVPMLRWLLLTGLLGVFGVLVVMFGCIVHHARWAQRLGLSSHDREKLMTEPTWTQRFWRRPEIARLLSAATRPREEQRLETPSDVMAALEKLKSDLGDPWRELLGDGLAVAREVAHTVAHIDDELRILARDGDPVERARLQQRLASMDEIPGDGSRQMRDLVAGQLTLMNQLSRRSAELASRRSRYMELLRTLWLQFAALRAQQAGDALAVAATTGQLRDLCRDVEHALAAEKTLAGYPTIAPGSERAAADDRTQSTR